MCAQLSRTRFDLRYPSQPPDEKTGIEAIPWQVPVPLPLPDPSRLRLPQCPYSNLVPLLHSDLPRRTGMAGATDACHRFGLLAAGQLLSLDCQLDQSAALDGSSAQDQMAQA